VETGESGFSFRKTCEGRWVKPDGLYTYKAGDFSDQYAMGSELILASRLFQLAGTPDADKECQALINAAPLRDLQSVKLNLATLFFNKATREQRDWLFAQAKSQPFFWIDVLATLRKYSYGITIDCAASTCARIAELEAKLKERESHADNR
jgi:hypothetical protein